jgi:RNA polymerase sigma factor FliA
LSDERLWSEYKRTGERALRDQLILRYTSLVRYVATKVGVGLPSSVEQSDLVSYGTFGLIDAIEKYDLDRGIKFETYAITRIRGSIIDELRGIDWVPRSIRAKARQVERASSKLEAQLLRAPTNAEVAAELEISEDELKARNSELTYSGMAALDEVMTTVERGEMATLADMVPDRAYGPAGSFELNEMKQHLATAIEALNDRERIVLTLYYYEGLTLAEIGQVLGVTESRVCQIHTKAVLQIRGEQD